MGTPIIAILEALSEGIFGRGVYVDLRFNSLTTIGAGDVTLFLYNLATGEIDMNNPFI
jgi:hypothetical protein